MEYQRCFNRGYAIPTLSASGGTMLAAIGAVLLVLWLLGFLAFHVTTGAIHILLVLAIIFVVMHFFRGRSATV
jgi:membrane-bound ClpP family serine protease